MKLLQVTSRIRLDTVYGAGSYARLKSLLASHAAARSTKGDTRALVPDDAENAALWGMPAVTAPDASSIANAIRQVRGEEKFDAILLVGGPEIVPHAHVNNPVPFDEDKTIASDNPYGCLTPEPDREMLPDVPVGRMAGDATGSFDTLAAHIAHTTAFHRARPVRSGACAVGSQVWNLATTRVAQTISATAIEQSPSFVATTSTVAMFGTRRLFVNLHGFPENESWHGQGAEGLAPCITPEALLTADLKGAVIFASNCYGAHIAGKTSRTSCALRSVANGALAFIGATCFSFGAGSHATTSVLFADRLGQLFFAAHLTGLTAGEALRKARREYVIESLAAANTLPSREYKTAMQFILLGDPTL